jgi:hypothetical protein
LPCRGEAGAFTRRPELTADRSSQQTGAHNKPGPTTKKSSASPILSVDGGYSPSTVAISHQIPAPSVRFIFFSQNTRSYDDFPYRPVFLYKPVFARHLGERGPPVRPPSSPRSRLCHWARRQQAKQQDYLPDSFEFSPEKSLSRSSRTPMRDLFGDSIAGFGEIHEGVRDDVLEIRDFSGHRSKYTEKCPVARQQDRE